MNFVIILTITFVVIAPIALFASWNERNAMEWIYNNTNHCPFKYKWQIANDLSFRDKSIKFSHLMILPKRVVLSLWAEHMTKQRCKW